MKVETLPHPTPSASGGQLRPVRLPPLWIFALVAGVIFLRDAPFDVGDVNNYHCYAVAFLGGARATLALPHGSCLPPATPYSSQPFHTLPSEYGPLALLAFLLPMLAPAGWYNTGFFIEMTLVAIGIAFLLECYGPQGAGRIWLVYALIGDIALTPTRFDVLPSSCVLIAILAMRRDKLNWAYVAVAIGTLFKFYPIVLLPLLLIESWRARDSEPAWGGPAVFGAILCAVEGLAATLSPASVLTPLWFMGARCVQIESLPATLSYIWARAGGSPVSFVYSYNAICELTPSVTLLQYVTPVVGAMGFALAMLLFWRRKITFGMATLLLIISTLIASKVFSPQFLLWASPLVALEYGVDAAALIGWGSVGLWTTLCYPLSYDGVLYKFTHLIPEVTMPFTAGVRNLLIVTLGGVTLWRYVWREEQRETSESVGRLASGMRDELGGESA